MAYDQAAADWQDQYNAVRAILDGVRRVTFQGGQNGESVRRELIRFLVAEGYGAHEHRQCTCGAGLWDGPEVTCDVHGSPSEAYQAGYRAARRDIADAIAKLYIPPHNIGSFDQPEPSEPTEWDHAIREAVAIARGDDRGNTEA